jgi:TRAP-type mannitol/chloroaromatic compound transport system permease small subunit
MCLTSTEMLALAKSTNKLMASAVVSTFQSIGTTIGRTGSSLILGLCMLTETWTVGGSTYTKYNSFFFLSLFLVLFSLLFLFLAPSIVPKHKDYYEPSN